MPYKRSYKKRLRRYRKRYRRRQSRRKPTLRRTYAVARKALKIASTQKKYIKTDQAWTDISTSGVFLWPCGVPKGDGKNARDGQFIRPHSLVFNGTVRTDVAATGESQTVRVIAVNVVDCQGTTPLPSDFITSTTLYANYGITRQKNFQIMYDKKFILTPDFFPQKNLSFKLRLHHKVIYSGDGATINDVWRNQLSIFLLSDVAPAGPYPELKGEFMYRYYD